MSDRLEPRGRAVCTFALDVTPSLASTTGVGVATAELARALAAAVRPEDGERVRLVALSARRDARGRLEACYPGAEIALRRLPVRVAAPLADGGATCETLFGRADLFHVGPLLVPRTRRAGLVVSVFDLTPIRFPEMHLASNRFSRASLARRLERADVVLAPSRSTSRDLVELAGVDEAKIRVIPLGVRPLFSGRARPRAALAPLGLDRDYILAVGSVEPRKNLRRLFEAFRIVRTGRRIPHRLAIVGPAGWKEESLSTAARDHGIEDALVVTGWVDEATLHALYGNAALLVYPSLYEGFGFPPLEAMAAGCPVAASRASSLPEIVGEAGLLFDPNDPEAIAGAIERLLESNDLRERLGAAGRARVREFSWERAAEATRAVYREAMAMRTEVRRGARR